MISFILIASVSSKVYSTAEKSFIGWMRETNQFYVGDEFHLRFGIWESNFRFMQSHNSHSASFTLSMNHLSALTPSEYQSLFGSHYQGAKSLKNLNKRSSNHKDSVQCDWRAKGVVSPVPNQGNCASDWAFATITAVEGFAGIKSGKFSALSAQNLIDCSTICYGCYGGLAEFALDFIIGSQYGKVSPNDEYPYTENRGTCRYNNATAIEGLSKYQKVEEESEEDLQACVEEFGPAAAAVDANPTSFQLYSSGIYNDESCTTYNVGHAVGVVGFGIADGSSVRYWIVKNFWGEGWGEKGYMKLIKKDNRCGIATNAIVAIA